MKHKLSNEIQSSRKRKHNEHASGRCDIHIMHGGGVKKDWPPKHGKQNNIKKIVGCVNPKTALFLISVNTSKFAIANAKIKWPSIIIMRILMTRGSVR